MGDAPVPSPMSTGMTGALPDSVPPAVGEESMEDSKDEESASIEGLVVPRVRPLTLRRRVKRFGSSEAGLSGALGASGTGALVTGSGGGALARGAEVGALAGAVGA